MSIVRVLVGTRKGAFILTSDEGREQWEVSGPHFAGREVYHVKGSLADPQRIYAAHWTGWLGQAIQRSDDGGATWTAVSNSFVYDGDPGVHRWYDGSPHPWEFKRVWQLAPSPTNPDVVYAGVEDAALFSTSDGGDTWQEFAGLRSVKGHLWQPGAGGMCLHTILIDSAHPNRIFVAISAAGAFRTDDGGETWRAITHGLPVDGESLDPDAEVGYCVHSMSMHPAHAHVLFMQNHGGVLRSDNAGDAWRDISDNLPSNFGFPIAVHAHEPETVYVVPITSDAEHYPPEGRLRVYRRRAGDDAWEALTNGLPQRNCYVNVLRSAMAVDAFDSCGVYFGTTGGQVYVSPDSGDSWRAIVRDLPPVLSVEAQTIQ